MTTLHTSWSVWADDPIETAEADALERSEFAISTANAIMRTHSWKSSIVFGLVGPWGSGKSSVVNMVREEIAKSDDKWAVRSFVPWAASDLSSLLGEFFSTLAGALPKNRGESARKALASCAEFAVPAALSLVPGVGSAAAEQARAISDLLQSKTWAERFDDASSSLRKLKKPVLIVIDDIDRLQADELLELLKVVRLLGRFPGVQYLLAYDEQTITDVLSTSSFGRNDPSRARKFVEKIVQYPLEIPPAQPYLLAERVNVGLNSILESRPELSGEDLVRLSEAHSTSLRRQLGTLRAVDRFLSQVGQYLPMHPAGEVNDADVILLTAVRLGFPELYRELPHLQTLLTRRKKGDYYATPGGLKDVEPDWDAIVADLVPPRQVQEARALLGLVYPIVIDEGAFGVKSSNRGSLRACSPQYFGRYFTTGVPVDDVADADVRRYVEEAAKSGSAPGLRALLSSERVGGLALTKCIDLTRDATYGPSTVELVRFAASTIAEASSEMTSLFSPQFQAKMWTANLMERLPVEADAAELVDSLVDAGLDLAVLLELLQRSSRMSEVAGWSTQQRRVAETLAAEVIQTLTGDAAEQAGLYVPGAVSLIGVYPEILNGMVRDVREALATEAMSLEGIVHHFIGIERSGDSTELVQPDAERLELLLPDLVLNEGERAGAVDTTDTSSGNRRRFAEALVADAEG